MKKTNNESGFSGLEFIVVILVIIILGLVGWLVYKDNHKTSTTPPKTTTSSTTSNSPTSGWNTYKSTLGGFSFKYPSSGWTLKKFDNSTLTWVSGSAVTSNEASLSLDENIGSGLSTSSDDYQIIINIGDKSGAISDSGLLAYNAGSVLESFANGLSLWQTSQDTYNGHGSHDPQCGSTNSIVMTTIASNGNLYYPLSNGKYLDLTGSFCTTPGETLTLNYQQQATDQEMTTTKEVLSSFSF